MTYIKKISTCRLNTILLLLLLTFFGLVPATIHAKGISDILSSIQQLENDKDPKCYATASRLENFMFGTPLSDAARFEKNKLQAQWIAIIWRNASVLASKSNNKEIENKHISQAVESLFQHKKNKEDNWVMTFKKAPQLVINSHDKRQYGSIAYSLRAILAAQQKQSLDKSWNALPLSKPAIDELQTSLDLFTLSVLKLSDQQARLENKYELDKDLIATTWNRLMGEQPIINPQASNTVAGKTVTHKKLNDLTLLHSIIKQKVASYAAYNNISNQLFVRNLQVYFARNRWPKDPEVAKQFRRLFTESLIVFATDLLYTNS